MQTTCSEVNLDKLETLSNSPKMILIPWANPDSPNNRTKDFNQDRVSLDNSFIMINMDNNFRLLLIRSFTILA